jgi:transcriptional regulator with GAF, ATPase, and Fis domain
MRAELFGYKRGSFTGALKDHEGLLAVAHKDTLFLDEVGDVSRDLQRLLIKAVGNYSPGQPLLLIPGQSISCA